MSDVAARARTGIAGLDFVLNGGLPRDHIYLIEGDPGVGKTTLAKEYAHRYAGEYDVAWWVPAEDPTLIPDTLADLARAMKLAVEAGRDAWLAGRMPKKQYADPSSPLSGLI